MSVSPFITHKKQSGVPILNPNNWKNNRTKWKAIGRVVGDVKNEH
jgi:hypothetical protein